MLWTLLMVLVVLWALGLFTGNALGGLIHILLVVAAIVLVFRLLSGRKVV
ncbi:MAG: lmo0937 family membrane protein [Gemmatimonadota bacterium]